MTRPDSARLPRFSLTERAAHWFMAATFLAMLGSGVTIGGIGPFGHRAVLGVHLVSAALLIVGVGLLMIRASARRQLAGTARELGRLTAKDRAWLQAAPHRVLRGVPLPTAGRFNGGQKMNSRLLALMLGVLYVSGTGELARDVSALGPLRPLAGVHGLAAGAMAVVVAAHAYMGAINPATRTALEGMTRGTVPRAWAQEHHADWVAEVEERG